MFISGLVVKHLGRGRTLGFPTANLEVTPDLPIRDGIYIAETRFENSRLPSLVFVGRAETFEEQDRKVEVYILDFKGNLYGKQLAVNLIKKIRDNRKFASSEKLVEQMRLDEREAREFFDSRRPGGL